MNNNIFVDTPAIVQVLGTIFLKPEILNDSTYSFVQEDFIQDFHKVIFESIYNLNKLGVEKITIETIEDYVQNNPKKYGIFQANQGRKYLEKISSIAQPEAFDFYYGRLKKFTLLRMYNSLGLDLSDIYNPNSIDVNELSNQEDRLNNASLEEIADFINSKIDNIKIKYAQGTDDSFIQSGNKALQLLNKYKETPDLGYPLFGQYINTITRGARLKKFYLRSAPSGVGKSRYMIADACYIGCDKMYDLNKKEWVSTGKMESTLYITTELDEDETTAIQLAFLSGVQEEKILLGESNDDEWARLMEAGNVLEKSKLKIKILSDYSLDDLENAIKLSVRKHGTKYVFFDYLHSTQKILSQISAGSGVKNLREDNVLFLISVKLKDLCNELNIFLMSSTQLNGDFKTAKIFDQNLLRGSKAIADKIDLGEIMLNVTQEDMEKLAPITSRIGSVPNIKMSVYKNRGGKYKDILIWMKANKGISRFEPMFITDYNYELIEDINDTIIEVE